MRKFVALFAISAILAKEKPALATINSVYPNDPRDELGIPDYEPDQ